MNALLWAALAAATPSLEGAWELEMSALRQERDALREEAERVRAEADAALAEEQRALQLARQRLAGAQVAADLAEDALEAAERDAGAVEDEALPLTLEAAAAALKRRGREVSLEGSDAEVLDRVLAEALEHLRQGGESRASQGTYFAVHGAEIEGEQIALGGVALFAARPDVAGALAPAGDGALRVSTQAPEAIAAWRAATAPVLVETYLLEPTTRTQEASVRPGMWAHIASGGALVWPILGLGGLAVLLILERALHLARNATATETLLRKTLDLVARGRVSEAAALAARSKGAAARVLAAGLEHWHLDREHLEAVLDEAVARELPKLERFLPLLGVIAGVAPLLGLLGTVTGMISTFEVITEHGTGDPKMLSGGISVALVTTELGLAVAIPVLLANNVLSTWVDKVSGGMLRAALAFNNAIHNQDFVRLPDGSWVNRSGEGGAGPHEGLGQRLASVAQASLVPAELKAGER